MSSCDYGAAEQKDDEHARADVRVIVLREDTAVQCEVDFTRVTPSVIIMRVLLALLCAVGGVHSLAMSPTLIRMERASRECAASFIYEGIIQKSDPLTLFDDEEHLSFWFESGTKQIHAELATANEDRDWASEATAPLPPKPEPTSNSPLLAARAKRATPTKRLLPGLLQKTKKLPPGVPEDAVPEGDAVAADDLRSGASRTLVRAKLEVLQRRRTEMEDAIDDMLDPLAAPKLPAFDVAVMLLFLSELTEAPDLPVPVACKEAVALSRAYSGDEQNSHRHVNGILASYARERLGRVEEARPRGRQPPRARS